MTLTTRSTGIMLSLWFYILPLAAIAYLGLILQRLRKREVFKKLSHFHHMSILSMIKKDIFLSANMKERMMIGINLIKSAKLPAVTWIYNGPLIIIASSADIQTVMNKSFDRGMANIFRRSFGHGILLNTGEKWHKSRRLTTSVFSISMMQYYLTTFNHHSVQLIEKIRSFANTHEAFDVWHYMAYLNLDIIFDSMADYQSKILQNEDRNFVQALDLGAELDSMRYTQPLLYPTFMYNMYLYFTGQWRVFDEGEKFIEKIIHAKIESNKLNKLRQTDILKENGKSHRSLLDVLLDARESDPTYTEECMRDDFMDVILAGSVTTARAISFALLMLAIHQDVQKKLYEEIRTTFGNTARPVEIDDINRLVYLDQCVKETLRKYPTIPLTFRTHSEDIVLNEKQTIPAWCNIVVCIYALHQDETLYQNADLWDPDHFAPEAISKRNKFTFLPFSSGPRSCIGAKYAMMSMKTQLIHLLQNYQFDTDMKLDDIRLEVDVAFKCTNGYWLKLRSRQSSN